MLHAKTAVADSKWARVGSTNLNIASWLGNRELDVVIEDEPFARLMEEAYLADLQHATEVVLDARNILRAPGEPLHPQRALTSGGGSAGRAAAGAVRIGHTVGAAVTNRRVLEPLERRITFVAGALLLGCAVIGALLPWLVTYPLVVLAVWIAVTLLYRSYTLRGDVAPTPPRPQRRERH
jgi:cardiolipin synthase